MTLAQDKIAGEGGRARGELRKKFPVQIDEAALATVQDARRSTRSRDAGRGRADAGAARRERPMPGGRGTDGGH